MSGRHPELIWPAPGSPALLEEGEDTLILIVAHPSGGEADLRGWLGQLRLQSLDHEVSAPLSGLETKPLPSGELPTRVRGFAGLEAARELRFVECRLRMPMDLGPEPPTRSRVFDLWSAERCLRQRCVAVSRFRDERLTFAFASDFHLSALWDRIIGEIGRHTPDLLPRIVNPGALWDRFVDDVNRLWIQGELDLVVLGGDLVDHVLSGDRSLSGAGASVDTNVHRFLESLSKLRPPTWVIPGNHDYRLFPWRPRAYGLGALGLTKNETRRLLRQSSLGCEGNAGLKDLHSLRTRDDRRQTALAHHFRLLAPSGDNIVDVAGMRLVFASTGSDALVHWKTLGLRHPVSFLRSLASAWEIPDSVGFDDRQLGEIAAALKDASGAAIFFHAPLLNVTADPGAAGFPLTGMTKLKDESVRLEAGWRRAGLREGVSFCGAGRLLEHLVAASIPVTTFSGHIHHTTRIEIDPGKGRMLVQPMSAPIDPCCPVRLLTAPAVGQAGPRGVIAPGYLCASFARGRLAGLKTRGLSPI